MDRDTSYRGRIGEKINPFSIINNKTYHKKNSENSWEYKEYPEFDINFICISKDGTLGEIWKVGDLYLGLPSQTVKGLKKYISEDGEEILEYFDKKIINEGLEPEQCVWKREQPPKEFNKLWIRYKSEMNREKNGIKRSAIRESFIEDRDKLIEENQDFVDSQYHKRKYGIFIKIDKEVHYLSGENWLFLQDYYLTESNMYGYYRVVAMESYWHWEGCRADSRVWGEMRGKGRRTSWSVESASMAINEATITKYAEIPIVSERKELAGKLFTGKIVNSYKYFPIYFKPIVELPNDQPKSNLEIVQETDENETSVIDFYPTKSTAYDSLKVKNLSINDEIGKWENESLTEFISRHSKCHTEGGATGRFGSTAGDYSKGGGEEFEAEFIKANALKRNKLGRTENGLVSFFIDVCYTMTQPVSYFDKWGYSIVGDPIEPIKNESGIIIEFGAETDWNITFETLKSQKKKTSLNGFLRDMPRKIEHMFRNEGGINNDFDIDNLNNHVDYLNGLTDYDLRETIFRGNLVWVGEPYKSNVTWRPNDKGKIFTTWIPDVELQNLSYKGTFHGKELIMPSNNHIGCLGIDSYDISKTVDGAGSNGAIVGYSKYSMTGCPSHSFFLKYVERPDKRDDFYDDAIKICKFFGMYALIESNKPRLLEYMSEKGFRGYSMTRPDKKWKDLSDFEKDYGGIPSSKQGNDDQANLLKDYIFDFIGQNVENDCKVYFKDMLLEWIKFNVRKRTAFDLSVAGQLALLGSQYKVTQRKSVALNNEGGLSLSSFSA